MTFSKLKDHIFIYKNENFYDVIVGAIELPTKLVMIDSGNHLQEMREFKKWVEEETGKKTEYLILTHSHGDHFMGNQLFNDAKIIATKHVLDVMTDIKNRWTKEVIENHVKTLDDKSQMEGLIVTLPNTIFEDEMEINDGDVKVIIKNTGGHTKGSSYIYCPTYDVLFAGDLFFENTVPYGGDKTCDPNIWLDAYNEFLALDVSHYVPGHGDVTNKKGVKKEIAFIEKIKVEMTKLFQETDSKEKTIEGIYKNHFSFPKDTDHDKALNRSTVERWFEVWFT